jgi:hypothetical protein
MDNILIVLSGQSHMRTEHSVEKLVMDGHGERASLPRAAISIANYLKS